jgi:hypothetical protein
MCQPILSPFSLRISYALHKGAMKLFQILGICLPLTLLFGGCKTTILSPREAFLSATKTQRGNYHHLYEVSPEVLRDRDEEAFKATRIATRAARKAMELCTNNCPILQQGMERIEQLAGVIRSNRLQMIGRLEMEYDPKTDTALFFHLQTDHREELGWAVMHGKKLKSRIVLDDDGTSQKSK